MDTKEQIIALAREIGELNSKISDQWLEVQKCIGNRGRRDDAIPVLNAYFRLKDSLDGAEHRLRVMLHTHYPDK